MLNLLELSLALALQSVALKDGKQQPGLMLILFIIKAPVACISMQMDRPRDGALADYFLSLRKVLF